MADNIPPPGSIRYVRTNKRFGVYAGSFDPMTVGHLWMVEQGVSLFDRLVVAVGINPGKRYTFPLEERLMMVKESLKKFGNLSVTSFSKRLTAAYAEPHRRYHNHQHIAECLAELDDARSLTKESDKVEWALWFHDAIYDPRAEDNEEKSAALARECLTGAGLRRDYVEAICRLVMVTKSHDVGSDMNAGVMVDVDLAILGQPEKRFCEYEAQIREEYGWVPRILFAQKRAAILDRFSARERIYATGWFYKKYKYNTK